MRDVNELDGRKTLLEAVNKALKVRHHSSFLRAWSERFLGMMAVVYEPGRERTSRRQNASIFPRDIIALSCAPCSVSFCLHLHLLVPPIPTLTNTMAAVEKDEDGFYVPAADGTSPATLHIPPMG